MKGVLGLFFAKSGTVEPCGLFSFQHIILLAISCLTVFLMLWLFGNISKEAVKRQIRAITVVIWILEICRIAYKLWCGDFKYPESYLPLYFCGIFLFALLLSSFGKGSFKRMGDVFLATGSLIGGIIFVVYPSTSLLYYPALHFISVHSFIFHSAMIYVGLLIHKTKYIHLELKDIMYHFVIVGIVCLVSWVVNEFTGCNFMFISRAVPGRFGEAMYSIIGGLYTPLFCFVQMVLPYCAVVWISRFYQIKIKKRNN